MKFKRSIQFAKRVIFASTRRDGGIERAAKYNYTSFSLRCKHSPERVSISGESITLDKKQPTRKYHSVSSSKYHSLRTGSFPRPSWLVEPRCATPPHTCKKTYDVAEKAILAKKKLRKKCVNRDKM